MSGTPEWDVALIAAGFTDGRGSSRASWSALARAVGVHTSTLTAMRDGKKDTDQATVDAVAERLRLDPRTVAGWVGRARTERRPYQPPADANLLSSEERDAVDRLIELLARAKKRGQHEAVDKPRQKIDEPDPLRVTTRDDVTTAALTSTEQRQRIERRQASDAVGEETQDYGGPDDIS